MGLPCTLFIVEKKLYNCQRTYFQFRREKKISKNQHNFVLLLMFYLFFFTFWPMFTWIEFFLNECASHWAQMLSAFHSKISVSTLRGKNSRPKDLTFSLQKLFGWKKKSLKNRRLLYFLYACQPYLNDKKYRTQRQKYNS